MPSLVVPNTVLVRLIWSQGGVPSAVNVLGGLVAGGLVVNQALANTVGSAIKAALTTSGLGAQLGTTIALANVGIRDIRGANLAEYTDTGAAVAGTGAGDILPPNVAACCTLRTGFAGKSFRGRVYFFGFTEASSGSLGTAISAVPTAVEAFVAAAGTAMGASGITHAVVSRLRAQSNAVIAADMRTQSWNTQRRRLIPGI